MKIIASFCKIMLNVTFVQIVGDTPSHSIIYLKRIFNQIENEI